MVARQTRLPDVGARQLQALRRLKNSRGAIRAASSFGRESASCVPSLRMRRRMWSV
jgi:hypothetical protein